jgi:hypothetical protein
MKTFFQIFTTGYGDIIQFKRQLEAVMAQPPPADTA